MLFWRPLCFVQFFVLLVIFLYLGLTPAPETVVPMFNDKLMHGTGYCIAAFSISFAFPLKRVWWRGIFLILFSVGIEIGQHFMPPRTFDVLDIAANSSGVILGLCLVALLNRHLGWFKALLHFKLVP